MVNAFTKIKSVWYGWVGGMQKHFVQGVTDFARYHKIDGQYCIDMPEELRDDPEKTNINLMVVNEDVWDQLLPKLGFLFEHFLEEIAQFNEIHDNKAKPNYEFIRDLLPHEQ